MKTIIRKDTKEYVTYYKGAMWTSELPTILAGTATLDAIKKLHDQYHPENRDDITWDDYKMVEVELEIFDY